MKKNILYIIMLLSSHHGFSQQEFIAISGNIRDAETNAPLAYANISVTSVSIETVSHMVQVFLKNTNTWFKFPR